MHPNAPSVLESPPQPTITGYRFRRDETTCPSGHPLCGPRAAWWLGFPFMVSSPCPRRGCVGGFPKTPRPFPLGTPKPWDHPHRGRRVSVGPPSGLKICLSMAASKRPANASRNHRLPHRCDLALCVSRGEGGGDGRIPAGPGPGAGGPIRPLTSWISGAMPTPRAPVPRPPPSSHGTTTEREPFAQYYISPQSPKSTGFINMPQILRKCIPIPAPLFRPLCCSPKKLVHVSSRYCC